MPVFRPSVRGVLVVALVALLGCKAETFGESDNPGLATDPPKLVPARQWSGSEVTLVSAGLAGLREETYGVRVAGRILPATRIAPDSVRVRLPADLPSGSYPVTLIAEGADWELDVGPIETVGWTAPITVEALLCSDPTPWPQGRPTGILVTSCLRDQPPMFVSTDGQTILYAGLTGSSYSPSTSHRPEAINDRSGRVARLDRFGAAWDSIAPGTYFSRHGYELGPGIWLTTGNHEGRLSNLNTGTGVDLQLESEWLLVRSPAGPRATFVVSVASPGVPILDTENGTIRARVPGLTHSDAAVFSPDGAVLYAEAGQYWCCESFLTKIDPETGAILQIDSTRVITYGAGTALAVDRGTPEWLYELTLTGGSYVLRIRSAADLSVVAEFTIPDTFGYSGIYPGLVIDAAHRRGNVFIGGYPGSHILRFDLLIPGD